MGKEKQFLKFLHIYIVFKFCLMLRPHGTNILIYQSQ